MPPTELFGRGVGDNMKKYLFSFVLFFVLFTAFGVKAQVNYGVSVSGTVTPNDCVKFLNSWVIQDTGAPCGTGSGSGTVTSVTFTGDGTVLSSTPSSAVTTSGTLTATLATQTANTVLGALTATTPSDLAVPSCSAATSALTWTSGAGFGCHTVGASGAAVNSVSGDGTIISNSASTGAVTLTLANAAANTVWGNNTSGSAAPGYQTSFSIASGTLATSLTDPLVIGGTAAGSALELRSTSGTGTTDFIKFTTGTNGGTEAMRVVTSGNVGIGTTTAGSKLTVGNAGQATIDSSGNIATTGTETITSASATALTIGATGSTNPAFQVDASTASIVLGLDVVPQADNGDVSLTVIGGTNGNLAFSPKGTGLVKIKGPGSSTAVPSTTPIAYFRDSNSTASNVSAFNFLNSNSSGVGGQIGIINGTQTSSNTGTMFFATWNAGTGAEAMRIDNTQNVGIGTTAIRNGAKVDIQGGLNVSGAINAAGLTTTSSAQTGTVCWTTGTGNFTVDTTTTCLLSSLRFKKDIQPMGDALTEISAMRPITFVYKDTAMGSDRLSGLIAEEVFPIDRTLVELDPDGKPYKIRYEGLTVLNTKAIQQLTKQVAHLGNNSIEGQVSSHKCLFNLLMCPN